MTEHFYPFDFTFLSDAYGTADGSGSTVSTVNPDGIDLEPGLYHYSFTIEGAFAGLGIQFGMWPHGGGGSWEGFHFDDSLLNPPQTLTGDFTVLPGMPLGMADAAAQTSAPGHVQHPFRVTGWVDPDGWSPPPPPPPDPGEEVGVHDPEGVFLADLTDAFGKNFRIELDGAGSFEFSINRYSAQATAINLARDNIVKFIVPQISDNAVFAGFLEKGDFTLVSSKERGGEDLRFGGRGVLVYTERDVAWTTSYILETIPNDGYWRFTTSSHPSWSTGNEPGQIIRRIADEMQDPDRPQHCMSLMTLDFDYQYDSDGNEWHPTDATNPVFLVPIGEDFLTTIGRLIATGVVEVQMDPDLGLHVYNHYGRDLTGDDFGTGVVRFVKGGNIADEVQREWNGADIAPYELVIGDNENYIRSELPDAATRVQKVIANTFSGTDHGTLKGLGLADLEQRLTRSESARFRVAVRRIGGSETMEDGRYLPGPPGTNGDFWVGDTVRLVTGTGTVDYDEADVRVAAITIAEDMAGNLVVTAELGATSGVNDSSSPTYGGGTVAPPGGSVGGPSSHGSLGGRSTTGQHPADAVSYDPTDSGLVAVDVQAAIDELATASEAGLVPYYVPAGETFVVPIYKQALFKRTIEVDGIIVVNGQLLGVD